MTVNKPEPESATPTTPAVNRPTRDLGQMLLRGWPFGDVTWPFRDVELPVTPSIKVEERYEDNQAIIRAEIPGVDPEKDIEVTVDEGILTIKAERRQDTKEETEHGYRSEFHYGKFVRQLRLPKGTSPEVVSATYTDGVLEVRMPMPEKEAGVRRVEVTRA
ncbi:HSP20 family protein [Microlunatus panaciterrae]|uniref:HSP20 family protein n=1 Tax=Microlunatus panaciterrae TaxID=400768 RepID=A0ABS2RE00_9ACTN|nr:Hsp20/alpha crystallin family protein [Microlunatus panaciterrae]MBM7797215.1 HSP20 family protein [Microlunatus panaciterrae]